MEVTGDLLTWETYGESVKTALGFFWKSGWAFVLGYLVSGMIQSFVLKRRHQPQHDGQALPTEDVVDDHGNIRRSRQREYNVGRIRNGVWIGLQGWLVLWKVDRFRINREIQGIHSVPLGYRTGAIHDVPKNPIAANWRSSMIS